MRQYLHDPFVFAIILTLLKMLLAILVEWQAPSDMILSWGNGFWKLLSFTTQMAVILAMGYVLAGATIVDRFLDKIVSCVHSPRQAALSQKNSHTMFAVSIIRSLLHQPIAVLHFTGSDYLQLYLF